MGHKLVLFVNRKLHTGFHSVPKLMTLSDSVAVVMCYFKQKTVAFGANCIKFTDVRPILSVSKNVAQGVSFLAIYGLWGCCLCLR